MSFWSKIFSKKSPRKAPSFYSYKIVQPVYAQWNQSDVIELKKFLAGITGKKLISICGSEIFQQSMKEAYGDAGAPTAAGMDRMLIFQFNLASDETLQKISRASLDKEANSESNEQNDIDAPLVRSF
jgi:hypothetical protein